MADGDHQKEILEDENIGESSSNNCLLQEPISIKNTDSTCHETKNAANASPMQILELTPSGVMHISDSKNPENPILEATVYNCKKSLLDIQPHNSLSPRSILTLNNINGAEKKHEKYFDVIPNQSSKGNFPGRPPPNPPTNNLTFKDCGGLEKQISFLQTAVLKPISERHMIDTQLSRFGLEPPKGILFHGPPGTGKTRLAQALGNELGIILGANVHFIYRKGKDIASKYFGQSSRNLRAVFEEAIENQPCVLFFDELDGLCPSRDTPFINQASVTIVTTMLGLLDELVRGQVFVIGATNRLDAIDPALRRPGRFDKYLEFFPPNEEGRYSILDIHTKKWKVQPDRDLLRRLSKQTNGFSGADLSKLCLDTFDHALNRNLSQNKSLNYLSAENFTQLVVTEGDWKAALAKMKPSIQGVFGSNLYIPAPSLGDHIKPLIAEDVEQISKMLLKLLPDDIKSQGLEQDTKIRSFYVWSQLESVLTSIDDVILSEVLRSERVSKYPIYCISPQTLSSTAVKKWPTNLNSVFDQAIGAGCSILYIQSIDKLWSAMTTYSLSLAINLKAQLERLRSTPVLLLTSGSMELSKLHLENPFREVLSEENDRSYEIDYPTEHARKDFFTPLFAGIRLECKGKWTNYDILVLSKALERAVYATARKDVCSVVLLYDLITLNREKINEELTSHDVTRTLLDIIGTYSIV